jgi:hypothetical protein
MILKWADMKVVRDFWRLVAGNGGSRPINREASSDSWLSVIYEVVGI